MWSRVGQLLVVRHPPSNKGKVSKCETPKYLDIGSSRALAKQGIFISTLTWKQEYRQDRGQEGLFPLSRGNVCTLEKNGWSQERTGGSPRWTGTQGSWAKLNTCRPFSATLGRAESPPSLHVTAAHGHTASSLFLWLFIHTTNCSIMCITYNTLYTTQHITVFNNMYNN